MKPVKERNCLNCEKAKQPGWMGNCGACPPLIEAPKSRPRMSDTQMLAKLTDAVTKFLEECRERTHWISMDMGNMHGGSIRIQQGQNGKPWHDAFNELTSLLETIKTRPEKLTKIHDAAEEIRKIKKRLRYLERVIEEYKSIHSLIK